MITIKGHACILISLTLILLGAYYRSVDNIVIGFGALFFLLFLFISFREEDFSGIYSKYTYYPFAYENEKMSVKLDIDLKKDLYFELLSLELPYFEIKSKIDTSKHLGSDEFPIEIIFKEEGRYKFPFPKLKVYDKNCLFNRSVSLNNDQMIFIKKKTPPFILDDRKASSNLNKIGILHSKDGMGDDEFKQLRDYAQGDDFRKIEWKSTARKGKFIIKEAYSEGLMNFFFIIDAGSNMDIGKTKNVLETTIFAAEYLIKTLSKSRSYNGFCLFDDKILDYQKNISERDVLKKFHNSFMKITGRNKSEYTQVFRKISQLLSKRSIVVIFSNLSTDVETMKKCFSMLLASKHRIFLMYPFEPLYEEYPIADSNEKLVFDSLYAKYEDEFLQLKNYLKKKAIRVAKYGPDDYETEILRLLRLIVKKEF
jgi:uncharacterized protein (DUF58 family)